MTTSSQPAGSRAARAFFLALSVLFLAASCATPERRAAGLVASGQEVSALAVGDDQALAKKLSNPVAALISVPLQLNYDHDFSPGDEGKRWLLNVQPVIPISISENWNVISRTIVPFIDLEDVIPGDDHESGTGDVTQSLFFSPKEPTKSGLIWGAGPAFLLPLASEDALGADKLGIGPTGVVLKQQGPWTYGGLANHIWSVAGGGCQEISSTFLQPFLAYTTPTAWTFALNTESTYDWRRDDWSVPINATVAKLIRLGKLPVSLTGGVRYWAEEQDNGPQGWGLRFVLTFLFPKG